MTSGPTADLRAKAQGDRSMPSKRERNRRRLGPGPARPARYGESSATRSAEITNDYVGPLRDGWLEGVTTARQLGVRCWVKVPSYPFPAVEMDNEMRFPHVQAGTNAEA
jgi:hypothetical protein